MDFLPVTDPYHHFITIKLLFKSLNLGKLKSDFRLELKPTTKLTPFVGSKDEWDTKEDPGKSMKNVLYV